MDEIEANTSWRSARLAKSILLYPWPEIYITQVNFPKSCMCIIVISTDLSHHQLIPFPQYFIVVHANFVFYLTTRRPLRACHWFREQPRNAGLKRSPSTSVARKMSPNIKSWPWTSYIDDGTRSSGVVAMAALSFHDGRSFSRNGLVCLRRRRLHKYALVSRSGLYGDSGIRSMRHSGRHLVRRCLR